MKTKYDELHYREMSHPRGRLRGLLKATFLCATSCFKHELELETQLAAEREQSIKWEQDYMRILLANQSLTEQLAAEQSNYAMALQMSHIEGKRANEAEQQLAAEQARCYNDGWVAGREPLQNQLAAEQEQFEKLAVASVDKIKTLVDTLKEIKDNSGGVAYEIAKAALEKVGK